MKNPGDSSPLGKVVLLTSLAAGIIAIYEWLKNSECNTPSSDLYGSSVCGWLGLNPAVVTTTAPPVSTGASTTTPPAPTTPTAAQLTAWMQNSINSPMATVSQWNWGMGILINGENPTTGAPNPGPFVGPGANLPGFTDPSQLTTASGYLSALQAYQAQGNTIPGLSGTDYAGFGAYWVPELSVHNPRSY